MKQFIDYRGHHWKGTVIYNAIKVNGTARFKDVNNCLNTKIYSYIETFVGQNSNAYLNVVQHQSRLEICGSLKQLFSFIGV